MYYIKLYFGIGIVIAIVFELFLWLLKDDLDSKTKQYYKKYGGFIYIFTWPYIFYVIFESIINKR